MNKTKKLASLSMFFPAYNEAGNIEEVVEQALAVLPQVARKYELLIINDGSKDATLPIAKRLAKKYAPVRVVSQRNRGYGGALKRGFSEARYEWIFFSDSDLQFNLAELVSFLPHAHTHDLVLGHRLNRAEGWSRKLLAYCLKIWNWLLLGFPPRIKDIDCAFKLIHKRVMREVNPLVSDGAMISTELLLKTHRAGFRYRQVGVRHYLRLHGQPTGSNVSVIAKAVADTVRLQKLLAMQAVEKVVAQPSALLSLLSKSFYTVSR